MVWWLPACLELKKIPCASSWATQNGTNSFSLIAYSKQSTSIWQNPENAESLFDYFQSNNLPDAFMIVVIFRYSLPAFTDLIFQKQL